MAAMQLPRVRLPQRHCDIGTCTPQLVSGVSRPAPTWPIRKRLMVGGKRSFSGAWTPMAVTRRARACLPGRDSTQLGCIAARGERSSLA